MLDTLKELVEKIKLGEDSGLELKEELPHKDSLASEIAAFANAKGGVILIGIDDNKEIVGLGDSVALDEAEKTVVEICQDSVEPPVSIDTRKLRIDGKNLLKIEVPQSLFVHKTSNGYFVRQGSRKTEMPTEQLGRLLQARSQARIIRFDEQFVPGTDKSTLRKDLFTRFLRNVETEEQENTQLLKRRLLVEDNGNYQASVAGLLMCSDQSQEYLYNSFISAVCYRGPHKDAHYQLDAKDFTGPLDRQILDACGFVKKHNQISARKEMGRVERPQYSMKAVFEAVVNAIVHRDYSKDSSKIRLFMFSDRLELYSPGALANTLTVETLEYGRAARNELLSRLLSELPVEEGLGGAVGRKHFLERIGEGVGIILHESEELSDKRPIYKMHGDELCLTIFAAKSMQQP